MPRIIYISIISLILGAATAGAQNLNPQDHLYSIHWKWGLVDMKAAEARVHVRCTNGNFFGTLTGESIPWEGRVYAVADTLHSRLHRGSEDIVYVNGWYRKPRVKNPLPASDPASYLSIQGHGELDGSPKTMEAVAVTANMLSLFYYVKHINFAKMAAGDEISIPISGNGSTPRSLKITYDGADDYAYNLTFRYVFDDAPESYKVKCVVDTETLLPVSFSSDILIGHVSMTLVE